MRLPAQGRRSGVLVAKSGDAFCKVSVLQHLFASNGACFQINFSD